MGQPHNPRIESLYQTDNAGLDLRSELYNSSAKVKVKDTCTHAPHKPRSFRVSAAGIILLYLLTRLGPLIRDFGRVR